MPPDTTTAFSPTKRQMREMKLREDTMLEILSPALVRCLGCGANIKLSTKSDFDASHWTRHRGRCIKKTVRESASARRDSNQSVTSASSGSSPSSARALTPEDDDKESDATQLGENSDTPPLPPIRQYDFSENLQWKQWSWSQVKPRYFPIA